MRSCVKLFRNRRTSRRRRPPLDRGTDLVIELLRRERVQAEIARPVRRSKVKARGVGRRGAGPWKCPLVAAGSSIVHASVLRTPDRRPGNGVEGVAFSNTSHGSSAHGSPRPQQADSSTPRRTGELRSTPDASTVIHRSGGEPSCTRRRFRYLDTCQPWSFQRAFPARAHSQRYPRISA